MNKPTTPNAYRQPIIFFDGYCVLCNRSINWVIKRDKKQVFRFASLQGKTATELLGNQLEGLDSVVLFTEGNVYSHYQAVGLICKQLPFPYSLGLGFYILPNFIYNWIARNRYRWFGKRETCRLPTEEEKARFLG